MIGIDASMFGLFREEVTAHTDTLTAGLLAAEATADPAQLEALMRAAHSIKGAARIVGIDTAVRLAHVMEDAFVAAQEGRVRLTAADFDTLLRGADVLAGLAALTPDTAAEWEAANAAAVAALEPVYTAIAQGQPAPGGADALPAAASKAEPAPTLAPEPAAPPPPASPHRRRSSRRASRRSRCRSAPGTRCSTCSARRSAGTCWPSARRCRHCRPTRPPPSRCWTR